MHTRIPLPGIDNPQFKDVMDYWERIQERKARQSLIDAQAQEALSLAERNKKLADLPFAGRELPGAAGRALAIQMIKLKYGENSPEYQEAKSLYDLEKERSQQTIDYQKSLMESQPKRFASTEGKRAQELEEIEQGKMPGSTIGNREGQSLTTEQQKKLKGQYNLKALKNSTDTDVLKRVRYSINMEKTLDNLNVDDLVSYSGMQGTAELVKDKYASSKGKAIPRYKKYEEALTSVDLLAKQVRQFYGDSITKEVQQDLKKITNPVSWLKNPDIAKAKINKFIKILHSEADTFREAATDADIYKPAIRESEPEGKVILYKEGKEYHIPAKLMHEALKEGFTLGD